MLSKVRFSEDRIPTENERLAVRMLARQLNTTFRKAWIKYQKREQKMVDRVLNFERIVLEGEIARGAKPISTEATALATLENIVKAFECSVYRACFIYLDGPEREEEPGLSYTLTVDKGIGSSDDADFYNAA